MSKWLKDSDGQYVNSDHLAAIWAEQVGSNWLMKAVYSSVATGGTVTTLNGTWSSQAAVQEAIRELVDGVDPGTYGD